MITPIEPQCADGGRYSVTEACAMLGIHRKTLERYRKRHLIKAGFAHLLKPSSSESANVFCKR